MSRRPSLTEGGREDLTHRPVVKGEFGSLAALAAAAWLLRKRRLDCRLVPGLLHDVASEEGAGPDVSCGCWSTLFPPWSLLKDELKLSCRGGVLHTSGSADWSDDADGLLTATRLLPPLTKARSAMSTWQARGQPSRQAGSVSTWLVIKRAARRRWGGFPTSWQRMAPASPLPAATSRHCRSAAGPCHHNDRADIRVSTRPCSTL